MKNIAVVILNYNGVDFLKKFLPYTIKYSDSAEIIVVDNHSQDNSISFLEQYYSNIKVICLDKNYGFAEGYNKGLAHLEHKYFVLLNSDVEVTPNWLLPLVNFAEEHTNYAALQPKILDYHARDRFEYAGAAGGYLDRLGYAFCQGRVFDTLEKDEGQYDYESDIFWASGACFFVRSDIFKQLGGFDSRFFAHMEEVDLCWRFHNNNFKVGYIPTSTIFHMGGGTLSAEKPFKTYLNFRNNLAMLFKNLPSAYLLPILFIRMLLDGIAALRYVFNGQMGNFMSVIKAHLVFYTWIPYLLNTRAKHFGGFKQLFRGSIIYKYFIQNKITFEELCSK